MKLQTLHEDQQDYSQITQLVAKKMPHPFRDDPKLKHLVGPKTTVRGTWMVMLGDLHIASIRRETMNWVAPKWEWQFRKDIPRYIYHPLIRATLTRLTREIEHATNKGPTKIFTADIHEEKNAKDLGFHVF